MANPFASGTPFGMSNKFGGKFGKDNAEGQAAWSPPAEFDDFNKQEEVVEEVEEVEDVEADAEEDAEAEAEEVVEEVEILNK